MTLTPATDLVIAYAFPPYVDTSSVVAAKRVRAQGRPVDVIQNAMGTERALDPDLGRIAGDLVRRRHEVDSPTLFAAWPGISRFTELGLQQALDWDRHGPGYERLYSRAHFVASHILAARVSLLRPDLEWTAEFSDPLSHDVQGAVRKAPVRPGALVDVLAAGVRKAGFTPPESVNVFEWAETIAYALADRIVFTNTHQRDHMVSAITDAALAERVLERSVVSEHPTLPPEFYDLASPVHAREPGRTHLAYFGNVYATRGMDVVLEALAALPPRVRAGLCLHLFTTSHQDLRQEVERRGLPDVVRVGGFVGYLDFLALARQMDVLLLSDALTQGTMPTNPYLPSKWSDYRGSGTTVWGLVEAGSVLASEPLDHRTPVGHVSATVQMLSRLSRG